jgi:DNA-binding GntR family transcriptional regulator
MYLEMLGVQDAVESASEDQIKEIYKVYKEMETEANKNAFNSYTKKNEQFHGKIIEISQNKLLLRLWKQSHIQDSTFFGTQLSDQSLTDLATRHKIIYDAIAERDEKRAKEVIFEHFQGLIDELDRKS